MRPLICFCLAALALATASAADAGGSIRAYVVLPQRGEVAFVDVDSGRVVRTAPVPVGAGPVAASVDGSSVLVANTARGIATQLGGIAGAPQHTYRGLGRPVAIALTSGCDTSPWCARPARAQTAFVADAHGSVIAIDLRSRRIVGRLRVPHPIALIAGSQGDLWVASAGSRRVMEISIAQHGVMRVLERPRLGIAPVAIALDSGLGNGIDAVARDGRVEQLDGVSLEHRALGRVAAPASTLIAGYAGTVWAGGADGRLRALHAPDRAHEGSMAIPRDSRPTLAGGVVLAPHGTTLDALSLGAVKPFFSAARLPGAAGEVGFAVLP
jgi:hypothetical protein